MQTTLAGKGSKCRVCTHPDRVQIESMLARGAGIAAIEPFMQDAFSRRALYRHRARHMIAVPQPSTRAPAPLVDLALMKAIARGRQWADDLLEGRGASVAGIAEREQVQPHYVRRLIRLAFLTPKIVEAIATGHQPPELTAKALTERSELPLLWNDQERALGIS